MTHIDDLTADQIENNQFKADIVDEKVYENGLHKYHVKLYMDTDGDGDREQVAEEWLGYSRRQVAEMDIKKLIRQWADDRLKDAKREVPDVVGETVDL